MANTTHRQSIMALHFKLKFYPIVYYDVYFCSESIINDLREVRLKDGLGSCLLSLYLKRLCCDWMDKYGHPILLVETFVDHNRFHGGVYRASSWQLIGVTKGNRRLFTTDRSPKDDIC